MAFVPTTWVDGSAPGITAAQLNRIEAGIEDAHERVFAAEIDIPTTVLSNGWTVARTSATNEHYFTVTHNLGHTNYSVVATPRYGTALDQLAVCKMGFMGANSFVVATVRWEHVAANNITVHEGPGFFFVLVLH